MAHPVPAQVLLVRVLVRQAVELRSAVVVVGLALSVPEPWRCWLRRASAALPSSLPQLLHPAGTVRAQGP